MSKAREVALLVGAGDAIGAAVARRFAKGGYIVCIARRDGEKSKALAEELRQRPPNEQGQPRFDLGIESLSLCEQAVAMRPGAKNICDVHRHER